MQLILIPFSLQNVLKPEKLFETIMLDLVWSSIVGICSKQIW